VTSRLKGADAMPGRGLANGGVLGTTEARTGGRPIAQGAKRRKCGSFFSGYPAAELNGKGYRPHLGLTFVLD
jgi:hypothetical protein